MILSPHFSSREFTRSQIASRNGIANEPSADQWEIIKGLCENILEPARESVGPIQITSGYRCPALNQLVGGERGSDHMVLLDSAAADIVIPRGMGYLLSLIYTSLPWSRLIWEYGGEWIHVSWCRTGRDAGRRTLRKNHGMPYVPMSDEEIASLIEGRKHDHFA